MAEVISNLEDDLVKVLHEKFKVLQTYKTYIQDAQTAGSQPCVELLQKLEQTGMQHVQELRQHVQEVIQKGKM